RPAPPLSLCSSRVAPPSPSPQESPALRDRGSSRARGSAAPRRPPRSSRGVARLGTRGRPSEGSRRPIPDRNLACARPGRSRRCPGLASEDRRSRRGPLLKRQAYPFHPFENESGGAYPAYLVYALVWRLSRSRESYSVKVVSHSVTWIH